MQNPVPLDGVTAGVPVLWAFFFLGFIITAGYAFALYYHWLRYGHIYPLSFIAAPIYGVGVLVLIGAMLTGINNL